jgi:hypothetical protein
MVMKIFNLHSKKYLVLVRVAAFRRDLDHVIVYRKSSFESKASDAG